MTICQLMLMDFMHQTGRYDGSEQLYDEYDLKRGIEYAEWLKEQGYTKEPLYEFNLDKFIEWARAATTLAKITMEGEK